MKSNSDYVVGPFMGNKPWGKEPLPIESGCGTGSPSSTTSLCVWRQLTPNYSTRIKGMGGGFTFYDQKTRR